MGRTRLSRALTLTLLAWGFRGSLTADFHRWTRHGPDGGYVWALAVDPASSDRLYAGTEQGGIARSTDGGASWEELPVPFATETVHAIAVDPAHSGTAYAGTEHLGLWKTEDGGATWDASVDLVAVHSIAIGPTGTIYGGFEAVYRSTDGGLTWTAQSEGPHGTISSIAADPADPLIAYAVGPDGLWLSTDGGVHWKPINNGFGSQDHATWVVVDPVTQTTLYAGSSAGVYKSVDGGSHWALTSLHGSISVLGFGSASSGALYAGGLFGVFRSTDGAANWTPISTGLWNPFVLSLAIDPTDADVVYAGTAGAGVFKTSDSVSWSQSSAGIHDGFVYAIATDPADPSRIYAGSDGGGVSIGTGAGETWTSPNAGLNDPFIRALAIDPVTPTTLYAGQYSFIAGGVARSLDAGETWHPVDGFQLAGEYISSLAVDPSNPLTLYAGSSFAGVYRTDDGGFSWNRVVSGMSDRSVSTIAIDPSNPSTLYAGTENGGGVFQSTDRGENWTEAGLGGIWVLALAVDPAAPQTIYAGTHFDILAGVGVLYKSTDGGQTWFESGPGDPSDPADPYFWTSSVVVDPQAHDTVYIGTGGGVLRSTDGGNTWTDLSNGLELPRVVNSLALDAAGAFLHAGQQGHGIVSYQLHFFDVPAENLFRAPVETVAEAGISSGCGGGNFCPQSPLARAQASVWLLRAVHGAAYEPPAATGAVFADVAAGSFAAAWIEELAAEGLAGGCGGGDFCPGAAATRAQMAVFLLRAKHGPTYAPPPATGLVFADVPADSFAAAWIEALAAEGITSGCGDELYCPQTATTHAQAAALLVRAFGL